MQDQSGIGTYTIPQVRGDCLNMYCILILFHPQIAKPLGAKLKKTIDSMVGVHLDAHVMGMLFHYQAITIIPDSSRRWL